MAGWDTARDNIVVALVALGGVIPPPGVPEPTNYSFIDRLAFYLYGLGTDAVLNDLNDVVITAPVADNEVLAYDTGTSRWINQTAAEAGLSVVGHTHDGRYYTEVELDAGQLDNRYYTEIEIDAFGFARKALNEVITGTWNFSNKLGIGTATVPHGGVGHALLAIEGADSSPAAGPWVQWTTAADDYPLLAILPYVHDDIYMVWDAYLDTAGQWRSSDAGSQYMLRKNADRLNFLGDTGVAAGSPCTFESIAYFGRQAAAWKLLFNGGNRVDFRDDQIWLASLEDGHLDVHADAAVRVDHSLEVSIRVTSPNFTIGANTLSTVEWAFLDGQDQSVFTTSSPSFVQVTSSIASGTAPFVVTSTTVVPNLNADRVDGYHQSQSLHATSSPTFAGLALTGDILLAANGIGNDNPILTFAAGAAGEATFAGDVDVAVGKVYRVNSVQVVGAQQVVEADIVDTSGTDSDGTCRSKVNALLAKLRTHGLIDT